MENLVLVNGNLQEQQDVSMEDLQDQECELCESFFDDFATFLCDIHNLDRFLAVYYSTGKLEHLNKVFKDFEKITKDFFVLNKGFCNYYSFCINNDVLES